ncbi:MAG: DegT/DnrJ/EryC1/StrS family aminotransferase [Myxococcales bacterium]|nr:DegT/DnrJ/EryC1/StrS family aminotransferase [Myxococcales bacterium]
MSNSTVQAAFLLAQLETLDRHASERAPLWNAYWEGFSGLADRGVLARPRIDPDRKLNHHAFFVVFPSFEECERVRLHLKAKEIAAYIGYVPLHSSKVGRAMGYSPEDLPITEDYSRRVLRMPLHHELTVQDVETVCREVGACFG